jgi:hypothetical protein
MSTAASLDFPLDLMIGDGFANSGVFERAALEGGGVVDSNLLLFVQQVMDNKLKRKMINLRRLRW